MEANSWVTGTNPVVDSFYERILAVNPKIKGRAYNVAGDGAAAQQFALQADFLDAKHVDLIVEALDCERADLRDIRDHLCAHRTRDSGCAFGT